MLRKNSKNYNYYNFSKFFISKLNNNFLIYKMNQPIEINLIGKRDKNEK